MAADGHTCVYQPHFHPRIEQGWKPSGWSSSATCVCTCNFFCYCARTERILPAHRFVEAVHLPLVADCLRAEPVPGWYLTFRSVTQSCLQEQPGTLMPGLRTSKEISDKWPPAFGAKLRVQPLSYSRVFKLSKQPIKGLIMDKYELEDKTKIRVKAQKPILDKAAFCCWNNSAGWSHHYIPATIACFAVPWITLLNIAHCNL